MNIYVRPRPKAVHIEMLLSKLLFSSTIERCQRGPFSFKGDHRLPILLSTGLIFTHEVDFIAFWRAQ